MNHPDIELGFPPYFHEDGGYLPHDTVHGWYTHSLYGGPLITLRADEEASIERIAEVVSHEWMHAYLDRMADPLVSWHLDNLVEEGEYIVDSDIRHPPTERLK